MKISAFAILSVGLSMAMGAVSAQAQQASDTQKSAEVKTGLSSPRAGDYSGMWQGMVRTASGPRRVVLDVSRALGDNMVANVVTSAQSPYSVLVDTFEARDRHIVLNMKTAGTGFEGVSNASMTEIRGTWKQDGKSTPLTLRRVDVNGHGDKGDASGMQSQVQSGMLPSQRSDADENPSDPHRQRRNQPAFSIAPPRWFPWYDWTPQVGNQDRPYGLYYW